MASVNHYWKELMKLWHAFVSHAGAARKDSGVALPRQLWELLVLRLGEGKLRAEDYYKLRVYRHQFSFQDKRKYLSNQAMPQSLVGPWKIVADDKLLTYAILGSRNIATPRIYAICHGLREYQSTVSLRSPHEVAAYLRHEAPYPMIAKPIRGMYSKDVWLLNGYDSDSDTVQFAGEKSLRVVEASDLCFRRKTGCLFQELLHPHREIRASISDRICTLRIIIVLEPDRPRLLMAVWKIAGSHNVADNYWRDGNLMAKLDQDSGRILQCMTGLGAKFRLVDQHPRTGETLAGFQVPCYREAIELVLRASKAFPDIPMQAWDIAITDNGPVALELNVIGSLFIPQLVNQQGLWTGDFRKYVEGYRRAG